MASRYLHSNFSSLRSDARRSYQDRGRDSNQSNSSSAAVIMQTFDPAAWKVRQSQKRLENINLDSAIDKARERMSWSQRRWAQRHEDAIANMNKATPPANTHNGHNGHALLLNGHRTAQTPPTTRLELSAFDETDWRVKRDRKTFDDAHYPICNTQKKPQELDLTSKASRIAVEYQSNKQNNSDFSERIFRQNSDDIRFRGGKTEEEAEEKKESEEVEDEESDYTWTDCSSSSSDCSTDPTDFNDFKDEKVEQVPMEITNEPKPKVPTPPPPPPKTTFDDKYPKIVSASPESNNNVRSSISITSREWNKLLKQGQRPIQLKKDLSWIETQREECLAIDSMIVTLEKWIETVKVWTNDPLEGLKVEFYL